MKKNIYLARQDGTNLYKIGITKKNPEERISELQVGNANHITLVESFCTKHDFKMETALHAEFQSNKVKEGGDEWFELEQHHVDSFGDICISKESIMDFLKKNNHYWAD